MDFKNFLKEIKQDVAGLIKDRFDGEQDALQNEVKVFIEESKEKLERWTGLLMEKQISKEEYEVLLRSQKDLLVLASLHKAGISKLKIGHFKSAVLKLVVSKAISLLIP